MISTQEIYNVLLFEFPYFKKINEEKRQLLCERTKFFIEGTSFIPKKGFEVTNRMKILISACSQQLTLGFKKHYEYAYFDKIIIYPEKYFSTITEKFHTGEMNTAGIIVLSWEDFYKGMSIDDNAHNVGLHEFAHALEFMDIADKDIDEVYSACLDKFIALAANYLKHQPDKPLFRKYATTNLSEFLAVATEYYFEKPKEFFDREPELFDILDKAYQQNILSRSLKYFENYPAKNAIKGSLIFGDKYFFMNSFGEVVLYLIVNTVLGFVCFYKSFNAIVFLLIGNYMIYRFAIKSVFSLYSDYVKIQHPIIKRLLSLLFPNLYSLPTIVDYENVVYVSVQVTENKGNIYYSYSLVYWNNGAISYANSSSVNRHYDDTLKFLYMQKKVATRVDGNLKKY